MLYEANILSLINETLGQNAKVRKNVEASYFCPKCSHYKRKLDINLEKQSFHCWVCNFRGQSLYSLFKAVKASKSQFDRLYKLTGQTPRRRRKNANKEPILQLPNEFKPIWKSSNDFKYRHAYAYLKKRRITNYDIIRHNIGYCSDGEYKDMIVIPSYDEVGQLNFFVSRSFYESSFFSHKIPPVSKNIIGFECFINWDEPITLVEGAFDALTVRKNAIPLFGKIIPEKLKEKIIENHTPRVNMLLDSDAMKSAIRNSIDIQKMGVSVHLIKLDGKDPSVLGYEKINEIINQSEPMTFRDLVYYKLYE